MSHVHEQGDFTKVNLLRQDTWASQVDRANLEQKVRSLHLEKRLLETDCQSLRRHVRKLRDYGKTAAAIRKVLRVENKELWAGKFSADAEKRALREEIDELRDEKDCFQGYFEQLEDGKRAAEDERSLLQEDLEAKILLVEDDKQVLRKNLQRAQSNEARLREQVHTLLAKEVSRTFKENALQQKIQDLEAGNAFLSARLATAEDDLQPNVRKFLAAKDELQRVVREFEAKKQENLEQPADDDHTGQETPAQLLSPPESEHSDSESWTVCDSSESDLE